MYTGDREPVVILVGDLHGLAQRETDAADMSVDIQPDADLPHMYEGRPNGVSITDADVVDVELLRRVHREPSTWQRIGRKIVHVAAVAVYSATSMLVIDAAAPERLSEHTYSMPERYPDRATPPLDLYQAPRVTQEALDRTDFLLSLPVNPELAKRDSMIKAYIAEHPLTDTTIAQAHVDYLLKKPVADRLGLAMYDPTEVLTALMADIRAKGDGTQMPMEQYMQLASEYLAQYGLHFQIEAPGTQYAYDLQSVLPEVLNGDAARMMAYNIVRAIASVPREYIETSGVSRFVLVSPAPHTDSNIVAYKGTSADDPYYDAIVFNMEIAALPTDVLHEFWHAINSRLAGGAKNIGPDKYGGMFNDPGFEATLDGAPYGEQAAKQGYISIERYDEIYGEYLKLVEATKYSPGCAQLAADYDVNMMLYGAVTAFATYYGMTDLVEEGAEVGSQIPVGSAYAKLLSLPITREQLRYELSVLGTYRPRLAMFFIGTSDHKARKQRDLASLCGPSQWQGL